MDMCGRTIRLLAAIDQEQDCFLLVHHTLRLRYANNAAGKWQPFVHDIRNCFWEEADDIAARLLSLRLIGALPSRSQNVGEVENCDKQEE